MILALALAVCAPTSAQSDLILDWSRLYFSGNNSVGCVRTAVPLTDGGAIVTGRRISRLDSAGATVWVREPAAVANPYFIVGADSDGADGAVVMASRFGAGSCFAFRYDGNGGLVWSTELAATAAAGSGTVTLHDAVGDGAGGIVGVGNEFLPGVGLSATIYHVDANGNEVARLQPIGTSLSEYFAVDRAPNGDYAISTTARIAQGGLQDNRTEVALFDSNFDLIWRRDFGILPLRARNVGFGGAGGVYVGFNQGSTQNASILRLDRADGSTLWQVPLASDEVTSRAFDYAPANGGGVFVCGHASSGPGRKGLIQRFFADGEPGPARTFGEDTTSDNKIVFEGIKRLGERTLAFGNGEEASFFPIGFPSTAGILFAFLPEVGETYCGPAVVNSGGAPADITAHGDPAATPTPAGQVAITAGQTWNFQCWYRDSNPMATSNATDAVSVTFD